MGSTRRRIEEAYVGIILILSAVLVVPLDHSLVENAVAGSNWTETSEADFNAGTQVNVVVTGDGSVELGSESKYVDDHFFDESKIGFKSNLIVDTGIGEVRLEQGNTSGINRTFGGPELEYGWDVQQTSDGGYILAGETVSYGPGFYDAWLIKTDPSGNEEWNRTFGGGAKDGARSVALTSDGGYIVAGYADSFGHPTHDTWLIKTDSNGNEQWSRVYGGSSSDGCCIRPDSVHQTTDGGYIVTGFVTSFGHGSYDAWLIKTNNMGIEQWNRTFGGTNRDDGNGVQQTADGGFIIVGDTSSFGSGGTDLWLVKTDASGSEQWNKTFGGALDDWGSSVYLTDDGGYIVTGDTRSFGPGLFDFWLIKTDEFGNEQWNVTFGDASSDDTANSIKQTADGGYIVTGTSTPVSGNTDIWLIKTDSSGGEQWRETYGGSGEDWAFKVIQTTDGDYVLAGDTSSYGAGSSDSWLVKANRSGSSVGELVSINLLAGQNASSIDAFSYSTFLPLETGVKVQFSQDGLLWYNSTGVFSGWDQLEGGFGLISLLPLVWNGSGFYYRMIFASNGVAIPRLNYIGVSYAQRYSSGSLTSQPFDCGDIDVDWRVLGWTATEPVGTEIRFQLRSADTQGNLSGESFVGPDGAAGTYYESSFIDIWLGHDGDRWIQYRAHFTSTGRDTPRLEEVTIYYNHLPGTPVPYAPANDVWMNDSTPTFNWTFVDLDGTQEGFQILIDDESGFGTVDYDSGLQNSSNQHWEFPSGTAHVKISDGSWYWKVRTQDDDGDWSQYSDPWLFGIDTMTPTSSVNQIVPYWNAITPLSLSAIAIDNGSGLAYVSLHYRYSSDNSSWADWAIFGTDTSGPWSWDFDFPDGDGYYEFRSLSVDVLGNAESKEVKAEAIAGLSTAIPLPPTDLAAFLSGIGSPDVTVSWIPSSDDGTGKNVVAKYEILRGSIFDSSGSSYVLYASVSAGTSFYVDVAAGEGDADNHFYRLCAISVSGLSSCASGQVGKFTRLLGVGPNLVSIPLIQSDESLESVLQTVEYDKAWRYDSFSHEWKWYMTSKGYRRGLWSINRTTGLWVNVIGDCNLTVAGVVPLQTTIQLAAGWNLVSFPSFNSSYSAYDMKEDTGAISMEGFDYLPPHFTRVLADADVLEAGFGYWVETDSDTVWVLDVE